MTGPRRVDDVSAGPALRPFEFATALAADRRAIGPVRHELVRVLQSWGHANIADDFALCAHELMANAVVHGCRVHDDIIPVSVRCDEQRIRFTVQDPSDAHPRVHDALDDETGGRGMLMVEAFADRWGVEARPDGIGKSVWMEMSCAASSCRGAA